MLRITCITRTPANPRRNSLAAAPDNGEKHSNTHFHPIDNSHLRPRIAKKLLAASPIALFQLAKAGAAKDIHGRCMV